jgi:hypothetical protein
VLDGFSYIFGEAHSYLTVQQANIEEGYPKLRLAGREQES